MKAVRQGDVLIRQCSIPSGVKKIAVRPIALGENTGHHHSLMTAGCPIADAVEMYEGADGKTYVRVSEEGVTLVHQQHKAQPVTPGEYVYIPQVENTDWGTRQVID